MSQFKLYKNLIDSSVDAVIAEEAGEGVLADACKYALEGGKRFRGSVILALGDTAGKGNCRKLILPAMAIECLHAASLVIDDLPCMDNDDIRRGKPSVHRKYGENMAQLVSASLIGMVFQLLTKNMEIIIQGTRGDPMKQVMYYGKLFDLLKKLGVSMGPRGMCYAEAEQIIAMRDGKNVTPDDVNKVILSKTASFFQIAFLFGYFLTYPERDNLKQVEELATEFGFLYQVQDDIHDFEEDQKANRRHNYAVLHGKQKALQDLRDSIYSFVSKAQGTGVWCPFFAEAIASIISKLKTHDPDGILQLKGSKHMEPKPKKIKKKSRSKTENLRSRKAKTKMGRRSLTPVQVSKTDGSMASERSAQRSAQEKSIKNR